ncbi:MAG: DUF5685 family protein [Oscillospiraceae bacterium]|nr:DUF5685 family protein [Oscillospiraceae bacterium]
MFGYVQIHKPELRCREYEQYRGVYCSLCRVLGWRYTPVARLFLNYDAAFYALLSLSVSAQCPQFKQTVCTVNPLKRCMKCASPVFAKAADLLMLMAYHKWRDALTDEPWYLKALICLLWPFMALAYRKAVRKEPAMAAVLRKTMAAQRLTEQENASPDAAAHPSAYALGELFAGIHPELRHLGYLLGRWVYLTDAAEDVQKDKKYGRFNPFLTCESRGTQDSTSYKEELLNASADALLTEYARIENLGILKRFAPIIDNVLTLGTENAQRRVLKQLPAKQKKEN